MQNKPRPIYFIHISDTHIGPTADYSLAGCVTLPNAVRVVEAINALPFLPDFVVHTGDVVTDPDPASYKLAAGVFSKLRFPIYFVTGNHDRSVDIRSYLPTGAKREMLKDESRLTYSFDVEWCRFITLDARGPDEIDPHGILPESHIQLLRNELDATPGPVAMFIHFPPIELDSIWFDRDMLLLNGEKLHETLVPFREKIKGVFFGHVHRGMQILRDGILYSGVASTGRQFNAWPLDEQTRFDQAHPPAFNFVTLLRNQTIIKEHIVAAP